MGDLTKCMSVVIDDSKIKKLKNQVWLGTTLVDYLIYIFFPAATNIIVPLSDMVKDMETLLNKLQSTDCAVQQSIICIRQLHKNFSSGKFHVMSAFCSDKHYYVVSIKFDSSSEDIFNSVEVYDSLKVVRKDNVKMDLKQSQHCVKSIPEVPSRICLFQ
jgi:hypothetical protein